MLLVHCKVFTPQLILDVCLGTGIKDGCSISCVLLLVFRNNMKPGLMMHLLMALILTSVFVQVTSTMMSITMSETVQQDEQQETHVSRRNIKEVLDLMIYYLIILLKM